MPIPFPDVRLPNTKKVGTSLDQSNSNFSWLEGAAEQIRKDAFGIGYTITGNGTAALGTALIDRVDIVGTNVTLADVKDRQGYVDLATAPINGIRVGGTLFPFNAGGGTPTVAPGAFMYYFMSVAPAGWLECDGSILVQATYPALFSAIGTLYNTGGEGAGNFRLPDMRGEFARGADNGRGVDSGRVFGSNQLEKTKEHSHSMVVGPATANTSPTSVTSLSAATSNGASMYRNQAATITIRGGSIGNTGGVETRPRNVALLPCIKF